MVFFLLPFAQAKVKYDPCPKGKAYHDLCLFLSSKAGPARDSLCENDGGVKFLPMNAKENRAAAALDSGSLWIAARDANKDGTWVSEDPRRSGKVLYTDWDDGQPDNRSYESCLETNAWGAVGKWNSAPCFKYSHQPNPIKRKRVCAMPRPLWKPVVTPSPTALVTPAPVAPVVTLSPTRSKRVEHPHVMGDLNVVKNLINAVATSHSDMDTAVEKVHAHVKSFKTVKNKAIGDLQKIRDQLSVMKGTLADKTAKLKAEDKKITGALAQLKAKWRKLNAQQSEKLDDAEERRAAENAKISKMITHLSRRRRME